MVASMLGWHERHEAAASELSRRLARREPLFVAAHTLAEGYAVLTGLPAPHRISPSDASKLLTLNFGSRGTVVALEPDEYRELVASAPSRRVSGGRIYDALIAACAAKARVRTLLTFDESDFRSLGDFGFEVVVP